jgi:sorting nexin-8
VIAPCYRHIELPSGISSCSHPSLPLQFSCSFLVHTYIKHALVAMSLFGDEDVPSRAKQSSSLFDDDPKPAGKTGNSLFADEIDNNDSPWAFPTPKKAGRGSLVKSLLPASDVPDAYIEAFDSVLDAGHGATSSISIDDAKKLMATSGVSSDVQATILDIVVQSGNEDAGLGRNEFNVLFALIALSQIGEDITLDSVDERKRSQCRISIPTAIASGRY